MDFERSSHYDRWNSWVDEADGTPLLRCSTAENAKNALFSVI